MKVKVRLNTFETNSSSAHTFTVVSTKRPKVNDLLTKKLGENNYFQPINPDIILTDDPKVAFAFNEILDATNNSPKDYLLCEHKKFAFMVPGKFYGDFEKELEEQLGKPLATLMRIDTYIYAIPEDKEVKPSESVFIVEFSEPPCYMFNSELAASFRLARKQNGLHVIYILLPHNSKYYFEDILNLLGLEKEYVFL